MYNSEQPEQLNSSQKSNTHTRTHNNTRHRVKQQI